MKKNAIFTICAKNYLAQAKVLGYSVKKFCPDCDFTIILSDEIDGQNLMCNDFSVIEAKNIGIDNFYDLAFKYDVIEFSTAIKPFFLKNLLSEYEKVLYLDPDMVVYSSLQFLFDHLDNYDALLTPHLLKPYINYESATSEETILWVGIFNLGFFGIKNSEIGQHMADWWMEKLKDQCFADKEDGLHVDQKWMDFLPALYGDKVLILRNPAVNIAFWNYHERKLFKQNGHYFVDDTKFPLAVFHFSSFDPFDIESVAKRQNKFTLSTIPEFREIFENYVDELKKNGLDKLSKLKYKYNEFENGIPILKLHRRLYRGLVKEGYSFRDQFSTFPGTYYNLLKKNGVSLIDRDQKLKVLKKTFGENPPIFNKIFKALILINKIFGTNKYYLMMRFFAIYNRFENQTFLIKDKS
ncbi:glycosyltransferase [Mucilaginibacter sp. OK268]|uniref:glycosyltransferase n=1 Tax=Mucilaginibacter sp. OK268 TaxID=1881048 RepID=UPI000B8380F1|nr:glycosyltransferase [Mucilaginibacter sp. OK268]